MNITCHAEFNHEGQMTVADLQRGLESAPPSAQVTAIMKDFGSQRDPDKRLVGLRFTWTEER